ncbi:MAG: guanylate kinase [Paludibacter sp.]|jgi:guanylate kinase|nr:guanylate kinase [Paludibacter sp.]
MAGKLIIFSAPSGAGKSTIVNYLINKGLDIEFSISATSRLPRGNEQNGVEYYFLTPDEFRAKIANDEFVEYEEVYKDCYYGTLKSEIDRIGVNGKNIIFDVDVIGGLNIKKQFGDRALLIFIAPPGIDELRNRLTSRGTDSPEMIDLRVAKAEYELSFAPQFDLKIVNDDLQKAQLEVEKAIQNFINET